VSLTFLAVVASAVRHGKVVINLLCTSYCIYSRSVVVCGVQKQWKGKAARTQANLAGFESLAKMAEEAWYGIFA